MEFVICVLATYAVTLMLVESEGPFNIFERMRRRTRVFDCMLCTSIYVAALIALYIANTPAEWLITALALSGAVALIDRFSNGA